MLPQKYQTHITHEINRILRDLNKAQTQQQSAAATDAAVRAVREDSKVPWRRSADHIKDELERAKRDVQRANDRALQAEKKAELSEVRARLAEERSLAVGTSMPPSAGPSSTTTGQPPVQSSQVGLDNLSLSASRSHTMTGINAVASPSTEGNLSALTDVKTSGGGGPGAPAHGDEPQVLLLHEYRDDQPIEDLVRDVAVQNNRGPEKAQEWLQRLHAQDLMTVGDLRDLLDEDWTNLGLTVFASRALRNALHGKAVMGGRTISPKGTGARSVVTTPPNFGEQQQPATGGSAAPPGTLSQQQQQQQQAPPDL